MSQTTETPLIAIPELKEGEVYAGAIFTPDGHGHHVILLAESKGYIKWQAASEWANSIGGDLPYRLELNLLYAHSRAHFEKDWYWSNETHESDSAYAWCQLFSSGTQDGGRKDYDGCRARAVRRLSIQ